MRVPLLALFLLSAASMAAAGASHAENPLHLIHEAPDDGYAYVGGLSHFGYVLLTEDGKTTVHEQGCIRVEQNGVVLYETTPDSSHDYNVHNPFAFTFPVAGPYSVTAAIPTGDCLDPAGVVRFSGVVRPSPAMVNASLRIDAPEKAPVGVAQAFTFDVLGPDGKRLNHTDAVVELRRPDDQWLAFRTHLHSHQKPMEMCLALPQAGEWLLRVLGYNADPSPDGPHFLPVARTETITVEPLTGTMPNVDGCLPPDAVCGPGPQPATPADLGAYRLLTTMDPQDSNSAFGRSTLSGLVYEPGAHRFAPHLDFRAFVMGLGDHCKQLVFSSQSLHEYDGSFDVELQWPVPGEYLFSVSAEKDNWTDRAGVLFTIGEALPPNGIPLVAASTDLVVTADGLDALKGGVPAAITFHARDPMGRPVAHSEISFQVVREAWGPPLVSNKLHTHESGDFTLTLTLPDAGRYHMILDPTPQHGEAITRFHYGAVGGGLVVPLDVGTGVPLPVPELDAAGRPEQASEGRSVATLPVAAIAAALAGFVLVLVRSRR